MQISYRCKYKHYFQRHGIDSKKNYNDGRKNNLTWSSNDTSVSKHELFTIVTYEFNEMVKQIYVWFLRPDKFGNNTIAHLEHEIDNSIKEQRHRSFGRCYTFHPRKDIRDLGVYYIRFYL